MSVADAAVAWKVLLVLLPREEVVLSPLLAFRVSLRLSVRMLLWGGRRREAYFQHEVDERLRKMNVTFLKSLEGISGAVTNEAKRRERERKR